MTRKGDGVADPRPEITPELAQQLAREGEALRREYRKRVERMWTLDRG